MLFREHWHSDRYVNVVVHNVGISEVIKSVNTEDSLGPLVSSLVPWYTVHTYPNREDMYILM